MNKECMPIIETLRLRLLPANNKRDNAPFMKMMREEGDFEIFCGAKPTEENLMVLEGYLERTGFYAIYLQESPEKLIGYLGFTLKGQDYDFETYISRPMRRQGYCKEAFEAVFQKIREKEMPFDQDFSKESSIEAIIASTFSNNEPCRRFLESVGFEKDPSFAMLMMIPVIEENSLGDLRDMVQYRKRIHE